MLSQFSSIFHDVNLNESVNVFESCCGGGGYFIPFNPTRYVAQIFSSLTIST